MPVVHVYAATDDLDAVRAIGERVHEAMVATIGIPEADKFQVLHPVPAGQIVFDPTFYVERTSLILIEISLAAGRTDLTKAALYDRIATLLASDGYRREDVFVSLKEVGVADFSLGDGKAQFAAELPPHLQALRAFA